jgi:glutamyl-tRNA reductase
MTAQIILLGMNHKSAPVEIREQLALACRAETNPLCTRSHFQYVEEICVFSTCNRVEFLFTSTSANEAIKEVKGLLRTHLHFSGENAGIESLHIEPYIYIFKNADAVKHLFRVASSLDSMVLGEPQILGQVKAAYREAAACRTVGVILNRLIHKSFSIAKRVRSETRIGSHAVSISYAAVELARKIFGELHDKRVMLIGAGEMAELAAEHFLSHGVRQMMVANRTLERAMDLAARLKAETVSFSHIADALKNVDIVLTSTGSPDPILNHKDVRSKMRERRNRPLFFIDIAVPRDVDPEVNRIDNVYLYNIDDLQGVVDSNRSERQKEAERAEHIIDEESIKFQEWLCTLEVAPTIIALHKKAETIRRNEVRKTLSHLPDLGEKEREAIEVLTCSIVNKMLHDPIIFLKKKGERDSKQRFMDFTQQLFRLDEENSSTCSSIDSMER